MPHYTFLQLSGLYGVEADNPMHAMILIQKQMRLEGAALRLAKESLERWHFKSVTVHHVARFRRQPIIKLEE